MQTLPHSLANYWNTLQNQPAKLHLMEIAAAIVILVFAVPMLRLITKGKKRAPKPLSFSKPKPGKLPIDNKQESNKTTTSRAIPANNHDDEIDILGSSPVFTQPVIQLDSPKKEQQQNTEIKITPNEKIKSQINSAETETTQKQIANEKTTERRPWDVPTEAKTNKLEELKKLFTQILRHKNKSKQSDVADLPSYQSPVDPSTKSVLNYHYSDDAEDLLNNSVETVNEADEQKEHKAEAIQIKPPVVEEKEHLQRVPWTILPIEDIEIEEAVPPTQAAREAPIEIEIHEDDEIHNEEIEIVAKPKIYKNVFKAPWDEENETDEHDFNIDELRAQTDNDISIKDIDIEEIQTISNNKQENTPAYIYKTNKEIGNNDADTYDNIEIIEDHEDTKQHENNIKDYANKENYKYTDSAEIESVDDYKEIDIIAPVGIEEVKKTKYPAYLEDNEEADLLPAAHYVTGENHEDNFIPIPSLTSAVDIEKTDVDTEKPIKQETVETLDNEDYLLPAKNQAVAKPRPNPKGLGFIDQDPYEFGPVEIDIDQVTAELDREQEQGKVPIAMPTKEDETETIDEFDTEPTQQDKNNILTTTLWPTIIGLSSAMSNAERENLLLFIGDIADQEMYVQPLVRAFEEEKPDGLRPLVIRTIVETYNIAEMAPLYEWIIDSKESTEEERSTARQGLSALGIA